MTDAALRKELIRLAHANEHLRPDVLELLDTSKTAAGDHYLYVEDKPGNMRRFWGPAPKATLVRQEKSREVQKMIDDGGSSTLAPVQAARVDLGHASQAWLSKLPKADRAALDKLLGKGKNAAGAMSTPLDRVLTEVLRKAYIAGQDSGFQAPDEDVAHAGRELLGAWREVKKAVETIAPPKWKSPPVGGLKNLSAALWELAYWAGSFQGPRKMASDERTAGGSVDPRAVAEMLRAKEGDMITIHSPKLRKPRTVEVLGRPKKYSNTGWIYLSVGSRKTWGGNPKGGILQYREKGVSPVTGAEVEEELTYQPTMMQPPMTVMRITKADKAQVEQYKHASTVERNTWHLEAYVAADMQHVARRDLKQVIDGKNIRLYTDRFQIEVVEVPQKPLKRRSVRTLSIHINPPGQQPFNPFIVENLLSGRDGAKIGKGDTYDQALKKLQTALGKAEEMTSKEWEEKGIDRKPDPWFPRIQQSEISYLLVEPSDYKPLKAKGKDFTVDATWVNFSTRLYHGDPQAPDPSYTEIESSAPASARKFYKMLKVQPDLLKSVSVRAFGDWLTKNKIKYETHSSVYR